MPTRQKDLSMLYFAYGSNMDWERMTHRSRASTAQFLCKALLPGYRLAFTRRTDAGTGAADIVADQGNEVWGVLYHIEPEDRVNLDLHEEVRSNQCRSETVLVHPEGERSRTLKVFTYVASHKLPAHQPPTRQYLEYLLNGARQARLPEDYIRKLRHIATLG